MFNCAHRASLGDFEYCLRAVDELCGFSAQLAVEQVNLGWTITLVRELEQAQAELFDYARCAGVTEGKFPFVWLQLRYDSERVRRSDIVDFLRENQLETFDEKFLDRKFIA